MLSRFHFLSVAEPLDDREAAPCANGSSRRLLCRLCQSYRVRMVSQKPETFFPELEGDEQIRADEWLHDYLRLVVRIHREHVEAQSSELSTANPLTDLEVLARSVRPLSGPPSNHNENIVE
jgi:hypothetical protein